MTRSRGGCRAGGAILLVEDNFILADNAARKLTRLGYFVVGPAYSLTQALALIEDASTIDAALVDLTLGAESGFPIVDRLRRRGVPVALLSGGAFRLPPLYRDLPCFRKPADIEAIMACMSDATLSPFAIGATVGKHRHC
jgi:CheY-like chemotaxis protein